MAKSVKRIVDNVVTMPPRSRPRVAPRSRPQTPSRAEPSSCIALVAVSTVMTSTTGSTLNKNCEWRPPPQLLKSAPGSPLRDRPLFAGRPAHRGGWYEAPAR